MPRGRASRYYGAKVLRIVALVLRVLGCILAGLVIVLSFVSEARLPLLLGLARQLSSFEPEVLRGILVFATPFGGAFRGDFALTSVLCFVLDWLACRVSERM